MAKCFKHVKCYNHFECWCIFVFNNNYEKCNSNCHNTEKASPEKCQGNVKCCHVMCVLVCLYWMSKWIWIHLDRFFSSAYIFRVLSVSIVAYGIIRTEIGWNDLKCIRWQMSLINTTLVLFGPFLAFSHFPSITHIFPVCTVHHNNNNWKK